MPLARQSTYVNPKFKKKTMRSTRKKNAYKKKERMVSATSASLRMLGVPL